MTPPESPEVTLPVVVSPVVVILTFLCAYRTFIVTIIIYDRNIFMVYGTFPFVLAKHLELSG